MCFNRSTPNYRTTSAAHPCGSIHALLVLFFLSGAFAVHSAEEIPHDQGQDPPGQVQPQVNASREKGQTQVDFREKMPEGWNIRPAVGSLQPKVQDGALVWRGASGPVGLSSRFSKKMAASEFVRLEADLMVAPEQICALVLHLGSTNGDFYFEFGRDPDGRLSYRLQDDLGVRDWTMVGSWPESGRVRLSIESADLADGQVKLYVNGECKLKGKLVLGLPGQINAGVILQAPANKNVDARTNNIVLVSRKPIPAKP